MLKNAPDLANHNQLIDGAARERLIALVSDLASLCADYSAAAEAAEEARTNSSRIGLVRKLADALIAGIKKFEADTSASSGSDLIDAANRYARKVLRQISDLAEGKSHFETDRGSIGLALHVPLLWLFSYTTPWRFEWYELNKLLSNIMTSEEKGLIEDFKRSRDYLAHARVINAANLHQLSERWDRVADNLTALVPGWDWPRSGQCLSMMVGPAAGGKSTWAMTQDIPVVSTDSLRIQMYGSLSVAGSQGPVFRTARAQVASLMRAGSHAILDASHLRKDDRVRNASMVPPDLCVRYVIVDRKLEDKLSTAGDRKPGLVEEHHETFLSSIAECLEGDRLQHVNVVDMRIAE